MELYNVDFQAFLHRASLSLPVCTMFPTFFTELKFNLGSFSYLILLPEHPLTLPTCHQLQVLPVYSLGTLSVNRMRERREDLDTLGIPPDILSV